MNNDSILLELKSITAMSSKHWLLIQCLWQHPRVLLKKNCWDWELSPASRSCAIVWDRTRLGTQLARVPLKQEEHSYQSKVDRCILAFTGARTNQRKTMALRETDLCSISGSSTKTEKQARGVNQRVQMEELRRGACMRSVCWETGNTAWGMCSLIYL